MKSVLKIALFFCITLMLFSCGSMPLPKDKLDYAGVWQSATVYLAITPEGRVKYLHQEGGTKTSINGPIQKFVGDDFEVGALGISTTFVVSEKPHQVNGVWKMTVDGRELTKAEDWTIQPK